MAVDIVCDRALASSRLSGKCQSHVRHTVKVVEISKKLNADLNENITCQKRFSKRAREIM